MAQCDLRAIPRRKMLETLEVESHWMALLPVRIKDCLHRASGLGGPIWRALLPVANSSQIDKGRVTQ